MLSSRAGILFSYVRPYGAVLVFAFLLGLLSSAMELTTPMVARWVLDSLGGDKSMVIPVVLLIVLQIMGVFVGWWQWVMLGRLSEQVVFDARQTMIRRFIKAKVLPLLQRRSGEMTTRVTSDSVLLREAASSMVNVINAAIMLVGSVVLMLILDWVLALATLSLVGIISILYGLLMPRIAKAEEAAQEALGQLGGALTDNLRAIKTIKVAAAEDRQEELLLGYAERSKQQGIRAVRAEALVMMVSQASVQIAMILVLGIGAWRIANGDLTVPTLVAFLLYLFSLMGPVSELGSSFASLQSGIAAAGRIREVEDLEVETLVGQPLPQDGAGPIVELTKVTATYDDVPAVKNIDLAIPRRGHTAIVGPSGAGKTTLLSLMLGFVEPVTGELRLSGVPYDKLGMAEVRKSFAYVEQETPILPGTLRDNLLFANPQATEAEVLTALRSIQLGELLENLPLGLDTPVSDSSISGGQRQRIALARAMLADPDVLLLDEATAQVDGLSEAAIHDVIRHHAVDKAVVTIAHRLSTVTDADRIVVMNNARIVAQGTHEELLATNDLYRKLVTALSIETG